MIIHKQTKRFIIMMRYILFRYEKRRNIIHKLFSLIWEKQYKYAIELGQKTEKSSASFLYFYLSAYAYEMVLNLPEALKFNAFAEKADIARKCFRNCHRYFFQSRDRLKRIEFYNILGECHYQNNSLDRSEKYLKKGIEISHALGCKGVACYHFFNLENIYTKNKSYIDAIHYYEKVLSISTKRNDTYLVCQSYIELATIYAALEDISKVTQYLEKALTVAIESEYKKEIGEIYHIMAAVGYGKDKNYDTLEKSRISEILTGNFKKKVLLTRQLIHADDFYHKLINQTW